MLCLDTSLNQDLSSLLISGEKNVEIIKVPIDEDVELKQMKQYFLNRNITYFLAFIAPKSSLV